MRSVRSGFLVLTAFVAAAVLGCSGGRSASSGASASGGGPPPGSGTGTIQVLLTADPAPNFVQSVDVTFTQVTAFPAGGGAMPLVDQGPVDLGIGNGTIDLVTLTGGTTTLLASGVVVNGDYDHLQLSISEDARLVYAGGGDTALRVRSATVDVPASFTVTGGGTTRVTLAFDLGGSLQFGDNRPSLRPMIRVVSVQ